MMSDRIEIDGKVYYEKSYLELACKNSERRQDRVEALKAQVKDAFESGYYYGATNQIDEDSAWEAYSKEGE